MSASSSAVFAWKISRLANLLTLVFLNLQIFKTAINTLTEPIDVYSDWIDACEAANQ